jgi:hypothetical protein
MPKAHRSQKPDKSYPSPDEVRDIQDAALREFMVYPQETYTFEETERILAVQMTSDHWTEVQSAGPAHEFSLRTMIRDGQIKPISGAGQTARFSRAEVARAVLDLDSIRPYNMILDALANPAGTPQISMPTTFLVNFIARVTAQNRSR